MVHKLRRLRLPALVLLAIAAITFGAWLHGAQPDQVAQYNQAMLAYQLGNTGKASQLLDQSLQSYDSQKQASWFDHLIYGHPSDEIAAMAHFHKGLLLLIQGEQQKKPGLIGQAVQELETSLEINPGQPYADGISSADAERLNEEALTVKHDLDLLFQKHPEQKGNSKGKGNQPSNRGDQPGPQSPGNQPGSKPGHGTDDGL